MSSEATFTLGAYVLVCVLMFARGAVFGFGVAVMVLR